MNQVMQYNILRSRNGKNPVSFHFISCRAYVGCCARTVSNPARCLEHRTTNVTDSRLLNE